MAKIPYSLIIGLFLLLTSDAFSDEKFERVCVECHSVNIPDLPKLYFRYLQKHGSVNRAYDAMRYYLEHPTVKESVLLPQVLKGFGLHPKIYPELLDEMLPIYFKKYDVKKRLKFKACE